MMIDNDIRSRSCDMREILKAFNMKQGAGPDIFLLRKNERIKDRYFEQEIDTNTMNNNLDIRRLCESNTIIKRLINK